MLNRCSFIGNLGADPQVKQIGQQGTSKLDMSIACSEKWKDQNGNAMEHTEWVNVVCWRGLADNVGKYCHKGDTVYVEGKLRTESWDDKNGGGKKYRTYVLADNIRFLKTKGGQGQGSAAPRGPATPAEEDDLPF